MLKKKIENHEKTIGMYVQLADISISRIVGMAGFDFVWVDTEHSYMSLETLFGHVVALRTTGTPIVVRLPQDDLTTTKRVLDMGVDGVIFPMVRTATEADRLIASTMYPPEGDRGFGPMNAADYGYRDTFEYTRESQQRLCRFIQIEHKDAIDHLDEIIQNPYIDGYIFGPNDLSGSYGMLGEFFSDKIMGIIAAAIKKLQDNGKYVGIAAGGYSEEIISRWSALGSQMLAAGADFDYLRDGAVRNRMNLERIHKR